MISLVEVAFLLIYAVLLAAVGPYVAGKSENYGEFIPAALSLAVGAVFWSILLWAGMSPEEGWIWAIVMILMPAAYAFGGKYFERLRLAGKL